MNNNLATIWRKIRPLFKKYGVLRASVFGSYASGENWPKSDIDILVTFSPDADLFDAYDLKQDIQNTLHIAVDIVSDKAIVSQLKPYIYKNLTPIYG